MRASIHTQIDLALSATPWRLEESTPVRACLPWSARRQLYYDAAGLFFIRAKALSGYKRLPRLLEPTIIRCTFDQFYFTSGPRTLNKTLTAIYRVYVGCKTLRWTCCDNPVTLELRGHIGALARQPKTNDKF